MTRAHGGSRDEDPLLDARVEEARRRIAAAIRRRRRELGLTQEQAAEKLGHVIIVSSCSLQKIWLHSLKPA